MTTSAGLLMFRLRPAGPQLLLAHPGGPLWARKDAGAWTLPKGELVPGEDALAAARREFREEIGADPEPPFFDLGEVRQRGGKRVRAWACAGDVDPAALRCNLFEMEWPPRSGRRQSYPEVDRIAWLTPAEAQAKILPAQQPFISRWLLLLAGGAPAV